MEGLIRIEDFNYELPADRIAQTAVEPRDSSKLLFFRKGTIGDHIFSELAALIPGNSTLFFNDAKVIPARLLVKGSHGANIEIFLLQPYQTDYFSAMNAHGHAEWTCLVGNRKKWKQGEILTANVGGTILEMRQKNEQVVNFSWEGDLPFIHLLEQWGVMPLPPYIKHKAGKEDEKRYQTVYSRIPGSVAAPTAGLHFTDAVLQEVRERNIGIEFLTLHVSAGTFMPVKSENALDHVMHTEIFSVRMEALQALQKAESIVAVGTTSCRVLESLYWCAVNLLEERADPFRVSQFAANERKGELPSGKEAVETLIRYCANQQLEEIQGETSIMIIPGYKFRFVKGLVTNFHQPKSTLLLLISAFIGESWKKVYEHALKNRYRFLSYGDSSFLLP